MARQKKAKKASTGTLGAQLDALAGEKSEAAKGNVDVWYQACLSKMKEAAKRREKKTDYEAHSVEQSRYHGSFDDFKDEFEAAAQELKKRIEEDGSVKATFRFQKQEEETIGGGGLCGGMWDSRTYPTTYKLTFTLRW